MTLDLGCPCVRRLDIWFQGSSQGGWREGVAPHGPSPSILSSAVAPQAVKAQEKTFLPDPVQIEGTVHPYASTVKTSSGVQIFF
jgi:hypothetical protein